MRTSLALILCVPVVVACGDGDHWVRVDAPAPEGPATSTLWVFDDDDVWLGHTSVWHYDGSTWTETPLPIESSVLDFWGYAPNELWAAGPYDVFRWDGSAWSVVASEQGDQPDSLYQIWGATPDDVWVANTDNSRVFHWNGQQWTRTTLQFVAVHALWGSSSSDLWLTGVTDTYRYDGVSWSRYESANYVEPDGAWGLWGFGADDVWAAGGRDELAHWDGAEWTAVEEDHINFGSYNGIWGSGPDHVLAVGNHGAFAELDGGRWTFHDRQLALQQNFTMLHGSSATNIWATAVDLESYTSMVLRYQP